MTAVKLRQAISAAEQVLHLFETVRPSDGRPRAAIEAARSRLRGEIDEDALALAAGDARRAARDATWSSGTSPAAAAARAAAAAAEKTASGYPATKYAADARAAAAAVARRELRMFVESGRSLSEIARAEGATTSAIWQRCQAAGIPTPPRDERMVWGDEVLHIALPVLSMRELLDAIGCSRTTIVRHATRLGIRWRDRHEPLAPDRARAAIQELEQLDDWDATAAMEVVRCAL